MHIYECGRCPIHREIIFSELKSSMAVWIHLLWELKKALAVKKQFSSLHYPKISMVDVVM